eukprot:COSAG02_NODE_181_length_30783_cov_53.060520_1_plen_87_part_00
MVRQIVAVSRNFPRGSESGPCDSGRFLLGVRSADRTPSKNLPESHRTREGHPATACSTSTVPGAASIAWVRTHNLSQCLLVYNSYI